MNKKTELIKNTLIIGIGRGTSQFIALVLLPIYTQLLTAKEMGIYDLAISYVYLIGPAISLQMEMAAFRYLIDHRGDRNSQMRIISTSFMIVLLALITSTLGGIVLYTIFHNSLFIHSGLFLTSYILLSYLLQVSRGLGNNKLYAIGSAVQSTILLAGVVLLLLIKSGSIAGVLLVGAISHILASFFILYRLQIAKKALMGHYSRALAKDMLQYSLALVPNGAAIWGTSMASRTIVVAVLGAGANGIFAISNKFVSVLTSLYGVIYLSWTESISVHINKNDRNQFISDFFNKSTIILSTIGGAVIVATSIIFPFVVNERFHSAYPYIPLLILSGIFGGLMSSYGSIYIATKKTNILMYSTAAAALVTILATVSLSKFYGLWGASMALVIGHLSISVYRHFDLKRKDIPVSYRISSIVWSIAILTFSTVIYFNNNVVVNISLIVSLVLVALSANREDILKIMHKVNKRRSR